MGEAMKSSYKGYRILLVHAHPDDETINNGATMALYAALGAKVTLVTCTRGEEGEVLVPGLAHNFELKGVEAFYKFNRPGILKR